MRPWLSLRTRSSGARASCARSTRRSRELERGRPVGAGGGGRAGDRQDAAAGRARPDRRRARVPGPDRQRVRARGRAAVLGLRRRARRVRALAPAGDARAAGRRARAACCRRPARRRAGRRCPTSATARITRSASCSALLAARQPVVLALDDLHWADSGSLELLGALLRRPPSGPVLIALAVRPRQVPERLLPALERAHRAGTLGRLELARAEPRRGARAARRRRRGRRLRRQRRQPVLPPAARALARAHRSPSARRDRRAGRGARAALRRARARSSRAPRWPATRSRPSWPPRPPTSTSAEALDALDELLRLDLVRATDVPRRFRFRHPLVRRAVYDGAPGGWRLAAHERAAHALAAAGAAGAARAHHVERYARLGDMEAVAVLRDAGLAADQALPASAAHWFAAALRLLPGGRRRDERLGLLLVHARALAQSGDIAGSREALLEGLRYGAAAFAAARAHDRRLRHRRAAARPPRRGAGPACERALDELPDRAVPGAVAADDGAGRRRLLPDRLGAACGNGRARRTRSRASSTTRRSLAVEHRVGGACRRVRRADRRRAACTATTAAALVDALPDELLAQRVDAGLHLMAAELHLDRFAAACRHGRRALERRSRHRAGLPVPRPAAGARRVLRDARPARRGRRAAGRRDRGGAAVGQPAGAVAGADEPLVGGQHGRRRRDRAGLRRGVTGGRRRVGQRARLGIRGLLARARAGARGRAGPRARAAAEPAAAARSCRGCRVRGAPAATSC